MTTTRVVTTEAKVNIYGLTIKITKTESPGKHPVGIVELSHVGPYGYVQFPLESWDDIKQKIDKVMAEVEHDTR